MVWRMVSKVADEDLLMSASIEEEADEATHTVILQKPVS